MSLTPSEKSMRQRKRKRRIRQKAIDRYKKFVVLDEKTGCWLWTGYVSIYGYGKFMDDKRKNRAAHRIIYTILVGPIEKGKQLDHLCRVRRCVNPAHLEPVTAKENIMRSNAPTAINARKVFCKRNHPLKGNNVFVFNGSRYCRTCHNAQNTRWRRRQGIKPRIFTSPLLSARSKSPKE